MIVEERFDDEGCSATTLDRPALHRLLGVIRSGGVEIEKAPTTQIKQQLIYANDFITRLVAVPPTSPTP